MTINIEFYGDTNVGKVRQNNEDNFLIVNLANNDFYNINNPIKEVISLDTDKEVLMAVADGLGGALAGEIASQLTVDVVKEKLIDLENISEFSQYPFYERLRLAVEMVNQIIIQHSLNNVQCTGMGSTFTGVTIYKNEAYIAQVGDSRAYLIRDNRIIQLTKDQSLVGQLLEAGYITEEEAENHHLRNVILQALGGQAHINVVLTQVSLKVGDVLLVCSDGLTTSVKNHQILSLINNNLDLKMATQELIKTANEQGGLDNITIVLAKVNQISNYKQIEELEITTLFRDESLPKDIKFIETEIIKAKLIAKKNIEMVVEDSPTIEAKIIEEKAIEVEKSIPEINNSELAKLPTKKDVQKINWLDTAKSLLTKLLKIFRFAT